MPTKISVARRKPASHPAGKTAADAPVALRQRILDTAAQMLETEELSALSMREVARRAGVTHQAPYHHFGDRESILAELVAQGFDELARRLAKAHAQGHKAAREPDAGVDKHRVLTQSGSAYVGFAIDHPGIFRIMFRRELCDAQRFPLARAASARAHDELLHLVALLHDGAQTAALTSTYWALVHGLAVLLVDGPLGDAMPGVAARRAHMRATLAQFTDFVLGPPDAAVRPRA